MDAPSKELLETVDRGVRAAREARPELSFDGESFAAYALTVLTERAAAGNTAALDWSELVLIHACIEGIPAALEAFDREYASIVPGAIATMGLSSSDSDDIAQRIRERLLVAEGEERPLIHDYAIGAGTLHGLVKVMAVREGISLVRKRKREVWSPDDELLRLPAELADPELESAKSELRSHFRLAFEEAVDELSARERNLLRMHLIDGATLEELARSYAVHRVTISRWLAKARHSLLKETRRRLEDRAGLESGELSSFLGMVESRVDLSLSRLLASRR